LRHGFYSDRVFAQLRRCLFEKPVTPLLRQLQVSSLLEKGWRAQKNYFNIYTLPILAAKVFPDRSESDKLLRTK
jgi:hypothetical protein